MSAVETIDECLGTEEYDPENTPDRYDAECIKLEMEDKERIPPEASQMERFVREHAPSVGYLVSFSYHVKDGQTEGTRQPTQ
ncbi:MAG: hypothetical protein M1830_008990 [Pleopsidium flavum]|nr:MAG: hypothetical protein M1830_008990 [Pleopsidium flavum]